MKQIVYKEDLNIRIDVYLSDILDDTSRSEVQQLIKADLVLVNDEKTKASYRLKYGDKIWYQEIEKVEESIVPVNYPLEIIYEDQDLIIINKPAGLVVYPGAGREEVSVVAALLGANKVLFESEDKLRPGVVHRLDKDTSGLMVLVKNEISYTSLSEQFKNRTAIRKYYALVNDSLEHNFGTIDAPIGRDLNNRIKMNVVDDGRPAKTFFKTIERFAEFSLVECELESGRTHQIRVHMRFIKHPIVNDPLYGNKKSSDFLDLMLQSYFLEFMHPTLNKSVKYELALRADIQTIIDRGSL